MPTNYARDMLPTFPQFRELTLEDRDILAGSFASAGMVISEMTFTNLFAWRGHYHPRLSSMGETLLIRVRVKGEDLLLPPVGPHPSLAAYEAGFALLRGEGRPPVFARVPQAHADLLATAPDRPRMEADRDNFDYLYRREDLAALPGRRFMDKRNHVHQFERRFDYAFAPLTPDLVPGCLALLEGWCALRHCADDLGLQDEEAAIRETLTNFEALGVTGGAILVAGAVEAFALGEPLSADTVVVHFEKANPSLPGLYQTINRDCCRVLWGDFEYVNREQDLGHPGLRQAKESYNPVALVKKYRVTAA